MPGEHPEDALRAGAGIAAPGRGILYTKLGEAITSRQEAVAVRDHYLWFFDQIRARQLPAHISVKPTQLGLDLSSGQCEQHLHALAIKADEVGSALWLDMEDSSYVDRTLDLYMSVLRDHPSMGIALQAYLYRTPDDLARLMPLRPTIRLVKGAYDEPKEIAFEKKSDTDRAYFEIASRMLEGALTGACLPVSAPTISDMIARIVDRAGAGASPRTDIRSTCSTEFETPPSSGSSLRDTS